MNRQEPPHPMLDDVAVYALGTLGSSDAERVRRHVAACSICAGEYARLNSAASALGFAAETSGDAASCPSTLLKPRIMAKIRADKPVSTTAPPAEPAGRQLVWPAYLVAAACLAIAIISSVWNVALIGQVRQAQQEAARATQHARSLAGTLADERNTLSDMLAAGAKHYAQGEGEVVTRGSRLSVAMHDLAEPPRGKVYPVWTLPRGAKAMVPSSTFVPDARGVAVIAVASDARTTAAVAVSVEPEGGSKHPTSKPIFVVPLT